MAVKNAFYAQSGGVTAVINASACGVLQGTVNLVDPEVLAPRDRGG
jgi:hypothetical protein